MISRLEHWLQDLILDAIKNHEQSENKRKNKMKYAIYVYAKDIKQPIVFACEENEVEQMIADIRIGKVMMKKDQTYLWINPENLLAISAVVPENIEQKKDKESNKECGNLSAPCAEC